MALNALQADMVRFTGTPGIEANGIVVGYKAEYTPRTSTDPKYNRLIDNKHSSNIDYSGQYYVQLGEELYNGDLTKKHVTDDFERPSYNWQFKGKEIGTYVDYTVLVNGGTFTEAVKYSELYELLTYTTIDDNDVVFYIDGVPQTISKSQFARSNKNEIGGQGVLTEVFVDRDRELVTISCINTYLAQANSDYNSTNETLSLKVYQTGVSGTTKIVDVKDVAEAAGVAKDDYRLVYLSGKDSPTNYEVVRMFNVDIMADSTVTKWSKDSTTVVDKLTTGGTEYKSNDKAYYDKGNVFEDYDKQLLTDTTYNIYMDRYGNVIGVDLYEGTKNYVFITGYDRRGSNISVNTATAAGIFTDGTMSTITVNVTDTNKNIDRYNTKYAFSAANGNLGNSYFQKWNSTTPGGIDGDRTLNRWYTYTVTNSGVYTLKPVERSFYTAYTNADDGISDANPKVLNSANLYVDDDRSESYTDAYAIASTGKMQRERAYGNDNSIYITVSGDEVDTSAGALDAITEVDGVYTGAQNVKLELTPSHKNPINTTTGKASEKDAYVYTVYDNKYYIVASVVIGEAQGAKANYAYILSDAKNERVESEGNSRADGDLTYYWEFEAVVNGEKTTLTAKSKYTNVFDPTDVVKYTMRELRFDGDYVVDVKPIDKSKFHIYNTSNTGIDKADIYDVGNMVGLTGWSTSGVMDSPKSDVIATGTRVAGTIELVGRTLYVNPGAGTDRGVGLALASDAKAVLIQPENGDREVTSCGSVSEALGRLADRGSNKAEYTTDPDGIQFRGRIAAVLDDGVAKWVVIISDTNLVTGNRPNYNQTSSVTFGNIRIEVYGMGTQNVTGYINADGDLNIVLPTTPTLARAIPDNYDVDVYVNGALIGTILTPSAQSTDGKTVTYTLTGAKLTATNMQIVARVYPEGGSIINPPTPGSTPIPAADVKVTAPTAPAKVGDTIGNATVDSSTKFTVTSQVKNPTDGKAVEGKNTLTVTLTATGNNVFSGTYSVAGAKSATVSNAGKTLTIVYEWTVDGSGTVGPKPPVTDKDATVKAAKTPNGLGYTFSKVGGGIVEDAEIKAAIAALENISEDLVTDIDTRNGTVKVNGVVRALDSTVNNATPLYAVTIDNVQKNIATWADFTGLPANTTYLKKTVKADDGTTTAANHITTNDKGVITGAATLSSNATEYVKALEITGADLTTLVTTGSYTVKVTAPGDTTDWNTTLNANQVWIQAGSKLQITKGTLAVGKYYQLKLNGTDLAAVQVDKDQDLKIETAAISAVANTGKVTLGLTGPLVKVTVNGDERNSIVGKGKFFASGDLVNVGTGTFVYGVTGDAVTGITAEGYVAVDVSKDAAGAANDGTANGIVAINSAVTVNPGTGYKLYLEEACSTEVNAAKAIGLKDADGKTTRIYVKANDKNAMIEPKTGSAYSLTQVTAPGKAVEGIWYFDLQDGKTVAADEFAKTISIGAVTTSTTGCEVKSDGSITVDLKASGGYTAGSKITLNLAVTGGTTEGLTKSAAFFRPSAKLDDVDVTVNVAGATAATIEFTPGTGDKALVAGDTIIIDVNFGSLTARYTVNVVKSDA